MEIKDRPKKKKHENTKNSANVYETKIGLTLNVRCLCFGVEKKHSTSRMCKYDEKNKINESLLNDGRLKTNESYHEIVLWPFLFLIHLSFTFSPVSIQCLFAKCQDSQTSGT